jgi:hypothetical protein
MTSKAVTVSQNYLGVVHGFQVWEVVDLETGLVIGHNKTALEPPDDVTD